MDKEGRRDAAYFAGGMKMEITQQTVTVSGVVKDKKGEPIIGANIMEKGTTNGTVTNIDGRFGMSGMVLSWQDASSCMCRVDRKH